jgi:SagB-type dehydrogenase family enzyme
LGEQVEGVPVKVSPMPGVSDGSLAHLPRLSSSKAEALWELHNSFRMPPKAYIGESFHLQHYKASNRSLTVSGKPRFYSKISYQLPEGRALPQFFAVASDDRVMTLQQLADLLMYSYGYQQVNGQPRLLPPTGGGLSSPEAYLTIHSLDGVPDGRYHYDARSHSLEFLGELNADRICSMLQVDRLPQVLLFGVASLHRVRAKYGNSAFKITNLDAGVAQTYIRQVALRLGLPQRSYQQWYSAGLMDELFIPHRENRFVLTHISGLGGQREPERYSDDMLGHFLSMRPSSQRTSWQEPADRIATQAGFDLSRVMKQRRAVRDFRPQALQLSSVLQLLADTVSLSAELQRHQQLSLQVNYWVVVRYDMPDHPAGLYRYQPDSQQLLPVYTQPDLDFGRFANQTSLTEAPVLLVFSANLFDILNREEDYGYKAMWQHIGQLAADLWLRSCAAGYVGTIAGGALEEALLTYGQTDGLTDAVLALFAFGHEREAQS